MCKRSIPTLSIALAIVMLTCPMSMAARAVPPGNTVQQWDAIAENTVVGSGAFQAEGFIYMGYVSAAVYDAVVSIEGVYTPYSALIPAAPGASTIAALPGMHHASCARGIIADRCRCGAPLIERLQGGPRGRSARTR